MHTYSTNKREYNVHILWKIAPKSKKVKISQLEKQLRKKCWGLEAPTPLKIMWDKKDTHWHNIMDCDLRYPIILAPNMQIADGFHRLCKAILLKKKYIRCRRFDSWVEMALAYVKKPLDK